MLAKKNRYSFLEGIPSGTYNTLLFTARYKKSAQQTFRSAVVISKKIDNRAVVRNKLRRKFLSNLEKLTKNAHLSYDIIFFLKKNIKEATDEEIKKELESTVRTITQ